MVTVRRFAAATAAGFAIGIVTGFPLFTDPSGVAPTVWTLVVGWGLAAVFLRAKVDRLLALVLVFCGAFAGLLLGFGLLFGAIGATVLVSLPTIGQVNFVALGAIVAAAIVAYRLVHLRMVKPLPVG